MAKKLKNKTVFVGISGGVDSSVSALLLKNQGYNVVGVFIRTWQPDFIECTWRDERRDAMRVCAHLDIPFLECNAEKEYKNGVAKYMIKEYKKGNTPNPDVMCNREIKFGVFWKFAKSFGADYIATGHYAIEDLKEKLFLMKRSYDKTKDQSYFLWTLTQDDLSHTLFPIGHLKKIQVRKIAKKFNLPTAEKKDSQGVCFLGPLDMKDFLSHYIKPKKGNVLDTLGKVIGRHDGATFFTIGERHGFTIINNKEKDGPFYVVAKDIKKNTIIVSQEVGLPKNSKTSFSCYAIKNTNWISGLPKENKNYMANIRYHGENLPCTIKQAGRGQASIVFKKPTLISPGQSIVLYDKEVCIGGGVVV